MRLRVGIMEGVLKQPREQAFAAARTLGFEGLELEIRGDLQPVRAASAAAGLPVCSLICGGEGMGAVAVEQRVAARHRLGQAIRDAAALGAGGLLWPLFDLRNLDDVAAVRRLAEDLRACMPEAEALGVVVAWENALDAAATREVIEQVGSDFFRCYFDFANAAKRGADPAAEIHSLGGLIYQVHAKNVNKQPLDAPGVDLPACLQALREWGYPGWLVLETPSGDDPLAAAAHNLRVLREAWVGVD